MDSELYAVSIILLIIGLAGALYIQKSFRDGPLQHERVERQGGSILLNKALMNFGIWWVRPISHALNRLSLSPDHVTYLSLIFGFSSGWFIFQGSFGYAFVFALFAGIADILDGMLAKLTGKDDLSGIVLDSTADRYVDFFLLAACAIFFRHELWSLIACLLAIHGSFMISYTTAKAEAMKITPPRGSMKRPERYVYLLIGLILATFTQIWPHLWPLNTSPLAVMLWLIALASNWSALLRFRHLFLQAKKQ